MLANEAAYVEGMDTGLTLGTAVGSARALFWLGGFDWSVAVDGAVEGAFFWAPVGGMVMGRARPGRSEWLSDSTGEGWLKGQVAKG